MFRIIFIYLFLLFSFKVSFAQNEYKQWYFNNAAVDFTSGTPTAVVTSLMGHSEGTSSIADAAGNLLFYTDGRYVRNANNALMPNGSGLLANYSSTQGALIVKHPANNNQYYIFTVSDFVGSASGSCDCFVYSIVDMTLEGGLGDVLNPKNVSLQMPAITEKLCAIRDVSSSSVWVMMHEWNSNNFIAYKITAAGIDTTPVISSVGSVYNNASDFIGEMKFSPSGDKIATALYSSEQVVVYDFDCSTGIVSNEIRSPDIPPGSTEVYGLEFSPDGSKLYVSATKTFFGGVNGNIYQFDLNAGSAAAIWAYKTPINPVQISYLGAMKISPDNTKIYVTENVSANGYLHAIDNPNAAGIACNFNDSAVSLGVRSARYGLPNNVRNIIAGPCAIPLPIELISFTGKSDEHKNILQWTTATEINNDYFSLERSGNANYFETIATIGGAGNSTQQQNYNYIDLYPPDGINYYRLKQTDFNGDFSYSNVIALENKKAQSDIPVLYFSQNEITVALTNSKSDFEITIVNAIGQIILKIQNENKINISRISSGIYFIKITQENNLFTQKFSKL